MTQQRDFCRSEADSAPPCFVIFMATFFSFRGNPKFDMKHESCVPHRNFPAQHIFFNNPMHHLHNSPKWWHSVHHITWCVPHLWPYMNDEKWSLLGAMIFLWDVLGHPLLQTRLLLSSFWLFQDTPRLVRRCYIRATSLFVKVKNTTTDLFIWWNARTMGYWFHTWSMGNITGKFVKWHHFLMAVHCW